MPTSLKDAGISNDRIEEMAQKCVMYGPVGNFKKLYKEDIVNILEIAIQN